MAKKKKSLSQAQIWDDTALLQSWDEALEEYKLYHSIHARGERVEDVLRSAEMAEAQSNGTEPSSPAALAETKDANGKDLEDGELEDEPAEQVAHSVVDITTAAKNEPASSQQTLQAGAADSGVANASMPMPVLAGVQDQALKNLMMSWYYAGYYTGLYEGQQKAVQMQAQGNTS